MIPTVILVGIILGRWWRTALLVAVIGWPLLVVASVGASSAWDLVTAAGFALVNVVVGVLLHQVGAALVRRLRPRRPDRAQT